MAETRKPLIMQGKGKGKGKVVMSEDINVLPIPLLAFHIYRFCFQFYLSFWSFYSIYSLNYSDVYHVLIVQIMFECFDIMYEIYKYFYNIRLKPSVFIHHSVAIVGCLVCVAASVRKQAIYVVIVLSNQFVGAFGYTAFEILKSLKLHQDCKCLTKIFMTFAIVSTMIHRIPVLFVCVNLWIYTCFIQNIIYIGYYHYFVCFVAIVCISLQMLNEYSWLIETMIRANYKDYNINDISSNKERKSSAVATAQSIFLMSFVIAFFVVTYHSPSMHFYFDQLQ